LRVWGVGMPEVFQQRECGFAWLWGSVFGVWGCGVRDLGFGVPGEGHGWRTLV